MELLEALGAWPGAAWLKRSGTAYMAVNAAHILGLGLLVGAILPLDLRLAGLIRGPALGAVAPFLIRSAAVGLGLAALTGAWLFTVQPAVYLANPAFRWKLALLVLALAVVAVQHAAPGFQRALAGGRAGARVRLTALASALLWLGVLLAGRWIGFL